MSRRLHVLLPAVLVAALAAAGCGSSSSSDSSASKPKPSASSASKSGLSPAQEVDKIASEITKAPAQKPKIPKPVGRPPSVLMTRDIVKGAGPKVKAGDKVTVQYVGTSWSDGKQFDASWDRGQPFSLTIPGQVIEGWNEGILGMRQGGRRLLVIPPLKGYGPNGTPDGTIKPNETLNFVIDLVKRR